MRTNSGFHKTYIEFIEKAISRNTEIFKRVFQDALITGSSTIKLNLDGECEHVPHHKTSHSYIEQELRKAYDDLIKSTSEACEDMLYANTDSNDKQNKDEPEQETCTHIWEILGSSPITGVEWINCVKCNISKEDWCWHKKYGEDQKKDDP